MLEIVTKNALHVFETKDACYRKESSDIYEAILLHNQTTKI